MLEEELLEELRELLELDEEVFRRNSPTGVKLLTEKSSPEKLTLCLNPQTGHTSMKASFTPPSLL
jgi:hypothetical protein